MNNSQYFLPNFFEQFIIAPKQVCLARSRIFSRTCRIICKQSHVVQKMSSCLVFGASRGIGFAISERLLRNGSQVAIASRNPANLQQSVNQLKGDKGSDADSHCNCF